MLEYGVKKVITNPTLITKAFILPVSYAPLIEKIEKEKEYKRWVAAKKAELLSKKPASDNCEDIMEAGIDSINEYIKD